MRRSGHGRPARGAAAFAALAVAFIGSALAQGSGEQRGAAPGAFDFYVLALSWSPGFCESRGERRGHDQCEPGRGLGFVVHGLWPQFERGYPVDCSPFDRSPPRAAVESVLDLFPSEGLARSEWRKHGTCSGRGPSEYFRDVRRARELVTIPEALRRPAQDLDLSPIELERLFASANPGLRPDMMAVSCRRRLLQEVRICLTRDLRGFRACPEVDRSGCRGGDVVVKAPR